MGLETGTYIDSLVATNPVGATDPKSQGDDHIRLIKSTIKSTFPNINAAMTATAADLNILSGAIAANRVSIPVGDTLRIQDSLGTDFLDLSHDGTDALIDATTTAVLRIRSLTAGVYIQDGASLRIYDSTDTDYIDIAHDGTDVQITTSGTGDIVINDDVVIKNGQAMLDIYESDQAADEGRYRIQVTGSVMKIQTRADNGTAGANIIQMTRTGTNADSVSFHPDTIDFGTCSITTDNDTADEVGFKGAPQNEQNGNYTLVLADAGKRIYKASGGAGETITIPANGSTAFPVGTIIHIINDGGGDLTIAITTDTLEAYGGATGSQTLPDNHKAVIEKVTTTLWKYSATG